MTKPMVLTAILGATPATTLAQTEPRFFMPEGASNHAEHIDFTMHFINAVTVFFFVLIIALMLYFAFKYRRRSPHDRARSQVSHNTALELSWSLPPAIIVIFMFFLGFDGFMKFDQAPSDTYDINVTARTWSWTFTYPNGYQSEHLHVPEGQNVRLIMTSRDVIHSLYVPVFRVKRDVVPGRYTHLWFSAIGVTEGADDPLPHGADLDDYIRPAVELSVERQRQRDQQLAEDEGETYTPEGSLEDGVAQALAEMSEQEKIDLAMNRRMDELVETGHILYCTEVCGSQHSTMTARVVVHPAGWLPPEPAQLTGVALGEQLFRTRGCAACHQLPGAAPSGVAAPSFAEGIYEQTRVMTDGREMVADREYLRRAIVNPMADITAGYPPAMPAGLVTDEDEIEAIIDYLITLP